GLVVMGVGIFVNIVQVGWAPTTKTLRPNFSKLSPLKGIKRVFGMKMLLELVKALLKFAIILLVVYTMLSNEIDMLAVLFQMDLIPAVMYIGNLFVTIGMTVGIVYIFIAGIDYIYNRRKHEKELRMTKQEMKEEYKQMEGDPLIKGKIRQKMREVSMRRMMGDVPTADVIITNPTHYAIALKYDKEKSDAPFVVAKGADHLAQKIKDIAKDSNITIVEDKPLARTLYAAVEVGQEIPPNLYQAVAEVLAYVYKLKNLATA
ncbi:MAG: flagellar biosynthesis protein FlhB, partial [Defluviitaleaceae bacterium]|nr:flagellar biosynthesis protein FlhB [Defluviitaleaceae bacterium]